ncbi:hypothetical protein FG99_05085 [Pseudomonas sp. AAC]|nr:hypothetical protein FG99_05085 [Pseudomonas sp. AAC]
MRACLAAERRQPADHRVAVAQAQRLAGQAQGGGLVARRQQQDTLAVQPGLAQPVVGEAGRRGDQRQPAGVLLFAEFAQDGRQQALAVARQAAQRQFAEGFVLDGVRFCQLGQQGLFGVGPERLLEQRQLG